MSIRLIPKELKASNGRELSLLMLKYQMLYKKQVNIINIFRDIDGKLSCWFYDEITSEELIKEQADAAKSIPR